MSCENCANAYDEGYTAGHNAENARLREQAAVRAVSKRFLRMATVQMPPVESGKLRLGMVFSYG